MFRDSAIALAAATYEMILRRGDPIPADLTARCQDLGIDTDAIERRVAG